MDTARRDAKSMRQALKRLIKASRGFTLVEMTVVVAVISVMAAVAIPAVTGVTTSTRGTSKDGDLKQVEQGVTRWESDNPALFPVTEATNPSVSLEDDAPSGAPDGTVKIKVVTSTTDTGTGVYPTTDLDATCGTVSDTIITALDKCFGSIDFGVDLVPGYIKSSPQHATADIVATTATDTGIGDTDKATADFTMPECNLSGDTCEFYLIVGDSLVTSTALKVWNVDSNNAVYVIKEGSQYGQ